MLLTYNNNIPMKQWCQDDKPATKMLLKGRMALSDSELPSIIIGNDASGNRSSKEKISTSRNVYEIFRSGSTDLPYESFRIILLNTANKVLQKVQISEGGVSGTVDDGAL